MLTSVQVWMIMRVNAQIRERKNEIDRLKKATSLVDDFDGRTSIIHSRSKENEGDIMRLERNLKKLSNTINAQTNRDRSQEMDVALTNVADYIQRSDVPSNEVPAPANPEDELGYRG